MEPTANIIGTTIAGTYQVLERLGSGGMGAVYKAEHCSLKRTVALKVLRKYSNDPTTQQAYLKRFEREAKLSSLISHPNAITIHDYGVDDDMPYLVMQYIEGKTLGDLLEPQLPFPIERCIRIVRQIAGAVAAAHKLGIVHRDLKPENVMVVGGDEGEESVFVLDFGIAKGVEGSELDAVSLTGTYETLGTPRYISPEQVKSDPVTPATDVYSLAVITYELLCGHPPFSAGNSVDLAMMHMQDPAPTISSRFPELNIPEEAEQVLMRSLEKKPSVRPQSIVEFAEALTDGFSGLLRDSISLPPLPALPKRTHRTEPESIMGLSKSFWYYVLGILLAITACALGYFLV